ncbi:D-alanyl-D-alanine carboxypeptidase/D-alanyl-D-alanine endopeptidase [Nocardioides panacisoli]|uniref:Serine-type D-Ala-D-Ala carboxypeptidase n=1 Tax=Nocardioides panacisoli TaxID=627624 RepID=A0ABP7IDT2_9ACTN
MAGRDVEHGPRRVLKWSALVLVLVLVAGAACWRLGYLDDWIDGFGGDDAPTSPADVAPPPDVDVPPVEQPAALARPADGSARLDKAAIGRAIGGLLRNKNLGKHVLAAVAPLDGSGVTYTSGTGLATPASTTKVVTSTAALFLLGPDHTFDTTTVLEGRGADRQLVLVGGGDPFLLSSQDAQWGTSTPATYSPPKADIGTLAQRSARELRSEGVRRVRLGYDDSLFDGPAVNPHWEPSYVPDGVVSPISALWVDEGRDPSGYGRVGDPSLAAAQVFAAALEKAGITVLGAPTHTVAAHAAADVASVSSPPLAQIVQRLIEVSDNEAAEVLLRQVGVADQGAGSIVAGQAGVRRVLKANGVDMAGSVLYDGSGLSRDDRMAPELLLDVLRLAADPRQPDLRAVVSSLPVAAYTGSLADRMDHGAPAGRGRVRAKTGTLTGVTALAGIAVDLDGDLMVFALMADRVPPPREGLAQTAMDDAADALGACHCGR